MITDGPCDRLLLIILRLFIVSALCFGFRWFSSVIKFSLINGQKRKNTVFNIVFLYCDLFRNIFIFCFCLQNVKLCIFDGVFLSKTATVPTVRACIMQIWPLKNSIHNSLQPSTNPAELNKAHLPMRRYQLQSHIRARYDISIPSQWLIWLTNTIAIIVGYAGRILHYGWDTSVQ